MNQEQNNLNQNNFNTQGNNGIPNNQPLQNNQNVNVNQAIFNNQQQVDTNYQQPINQMNIQEPNPQPMNSFENGNTNQSFNSKPPKKMNLYLIIGIIVAVLAIIGVSTFMIFGNNNSKTNNEAQNNTTSESQSSADNNTSNTNDLNYDELMKMYVSINDNEIFLNKTTIEEFLETSKWTNYEESSFSTEVNKAIILKDGVNEITLTYLKSNNIIFQITTNENFDSSVTKIQYKDSYIGTLNIGDNIPKEILNEKYKINIENYRFYLKRNTNEDLIILYKSTEPIVMNYLYHDAQNNLTGFSAWWYIY